MRSSLVFAVILSAMIFDSVIRQFLTLASQYWEVIGLPVASFGLIGSSMALLGWRSPMWRAVGHGLFSASQFLFH